jgi:hypothetical protein
MSWAAILVSVLFILVTFSRHVDAAPVESEKRIDRFDNLLEKAKESMTGTIGFNLTILAPRLRTVPIPRWNTGGKYSAGSLSDCSLSNSHRF